LVVPETSFFRGPGLFEHLARHIAAAAGPPVRVLSLPCSTGEEPYSLAVALAEAGVPADRYTIDAADVSPPALAAARRGVYRDFSFRQAPPWLRDRYFRPAAGGWELSPEIRGRVRFHHANLLDPGSLPAGPFDVVLCRNLLIYFTPAARRRAAAALAGLSAPDGLLAVGHAEPGCLAGGPFRPTGPDGLFLFARDPLPGHALIPVTASAKPPQVVPVTRLRARPPQGGHPSKSDPLDPLGPRPEPPLARARRLADVGRLADALAVCEAAVTAAPSADGYALLGVIRHARGEPGPAAAAFRRALYLDPAHREALAHAMLLSRAAGNADQADAYQARLARAKGGES
jgi:chemotaxis protein methyltransferase WspC